MTDECLVDTLPHIMKRFGHYIFSATGEGT
jgi:hypothetical protein